MCVRRVATKPMAASPPAHVRITTIAQLRAAVSRLAAEYPDRRLVFRGQIHDYPLVPSAARLDESDEQTWMRTALTTVWESFAAFFLDDLCERALMERSRIVPAGMALLQHYGWRSWFIDVTFEPLIACWFALNRWNGEAIYVKPYDCQTEDGTCSTRPIDHSISQLRKAW